MMARKKRIHICSLTKKKDKAGKAYFEGKFGNATLIIMCDEKIDPKADAVALLEQASIDDDAGQSEEQDLVIV